METDSQCYNQALLNQIEEAYGRVLYSYTTHVIHAGRIQENNSRLKWAQFLFSAISTGGFIGNLITNKLILIWIGGVCSTLLLVLTTYFKDYDFNSLYKKHMDTSNKLWLFKEKYLNLLTDFSVLSNEDIVEQRDELQVSVYEIYKEAPITDSRSYSLAQKALKKNEAQFFSRRELNQILPETLRKSNEENAK